LSARTDPSAEAERVRAEKVQTALYRIAELASRAQDLQEFYRVVHDVVGELMDANNFFIALYDEERQLINWPYYVDEVDTNVVDPNQWEVFGEGEARGTTAYVLRTGEPQLLTYGRLLELIEQGEVELRGFAAEESTWLGVPLMADERALGVVAVQSYTADVTYSEQDKQLLAFVGRHIGVALSRARAIEETRQRNAELALINSVQDALAGELDLQAIYEVVGEKIQEVFDAQVVDVGIYDGASGLIHFPYTIERGVRFPDEPIPLIGFRKHVMESREPLMLEESSPEIAERYGNPFVLSGEPVRSALFVPLVVGGRATGVISLQNLDRTHAFTEADQRLLTTLAGSLSVALDNARLVHETRQRNAELALINSVQVAIAGALDLQQIYDLVGEKIQEVFDAQVVDISTYDASTGMLHTPYAVERGVRYFDPSAPLTEFGFKRYVVETGESILAENALDAPERYGIKVRLDGSGEDAKSFLFMPLVTAGKVTGVISLQNLDREHVFDESHRRLLATIAGSLSAALDNARLIHETRQRNAELALINGVQAAVAGELDPRAIYEIVGEKIEEVYDAQVVSISTYDEATGLLSFPYVVERGERFELEPMPVIGFRKHVLETAQPLLVNENLAEVAERYGNPASLAGEAPKSVLFVPLFTGGRTSGVISLQNVDREHAFSESDERLLLTLAGSISAALENARLLQETRQRNAELALINSVQAAIAGELDPQAAYDVVGDKVREVFDAQVVSISVYDEASGLLNFPYVIERGERLQEKPIPLIGFRKHVMESREPLMLEEVSPDVAERYGNPYVLSGEPVRSALFVPLLVGGRATGVISLQNVDRTYAFTEADQRLLTTLAGSLSVALDNARLVHETRQRVAELDTVNSVAQALASQLDLRALLELVGERVRETFEADIAYVALHDEAAGKIEFVYYHETGERRHEPPLEYGHGLTSQILDSREPLLLNREAQYEGVPTVGTPSRSFLGVPILVGEQAIGVISVQSINEEGRFGDAETGLLATIAASVGVAIQNARLFEAQRQAEQEYRELVEELPLAVYRDAPLALAPSEYVSPRVEEMFGYPRSAWSDPEFFASILHPDDRDEAIAMHAAALARGDDRWSFEYRLVASDGRTVFVRDDARIVKDETGGPVYVQGFMIDVTGQALAHAEIRRQKQFFESLVEISPVAVVVMDAGERITGWNPAAADLFGYSPDDALGQTIDDLVFKTGRKDEGRQITLEALERGRAQRIAQRERKDGTLVDVELMLVPLRFDGEHVGFYAIYHDITELQRARNEAEAATQAKSAFLATMSHEIRTPMNGVIGMTDLLLGTELTGEQREFTEVVRSSGDALLHVIDDILDYSKIEAGKLELEREPLDLRECVERALEIVAPRAWEKGIELGCLIDEDAPAGIVGDAARLRQVLLNLLSNAVKFTEEGEVVVLVEAEQAPEGNCRLELAVRDTGIGIPRDRMDRLFTSFSQVDASTTRRYGGTGLGLAISKRLIELMGGTIRAESEEGTGSTFRISLTAAPAELPTRAAADDGLPQLLGKRILVVDDNATNREIVTRHARSWRMEPIAVERPSEALALIDAGELFDVAVLDMVMPDMDGLALAREIRRRRSRDELPLLLLTSLGRLSQEGASDEFEAQLAKPVRASQLYNALVRIAAEGDEPEPTAELEQPGKGGSSLRILLAEDNAVNQKVALRLLEQLGYAADVASNGIEALEALERRQYDVVLMDVQMPELDGLDATRRICERWPDTRPRIVAMTANALPEDREACFAAGMDDYVAKPIRPDALAGALKRVRPTVSDDGPSPKEAAARVDGTALESLRELGGDEFLAEVIDTFLADVPTLLATLHRSLAAADAAELRRAAHTLKSNGATLGAAEFAEVCRELEQHAKDVRLEAAPALVARVEDEYRSLEGALVTLRPKAAT
jgi:PAS domain S-box-containing protein